MPYLANLQELTRPHIPGVSFPLLRQARWRPKTERPQADVVNWRNISVALLEPPEVMRIWQEVGASVVRNCEFEIRLLEQLYTFKRGGEVLQFIERYSFLVPVMLEAYSIIENYFGPYPQVFLEVVSDPEVKGLVGLFGYIATRLTYEEAGKRLRRFDRDWFLNQLHQVKGLLNFDVEFL